MIKFEHVNGGMAVGPCMLRARGLHSVDRQTDRKTNSLTRH